MFRSDDLIGIGMEADALRRKLHPEGTVTYIIDRNINYTNFCTEYCTFCAFYRPLKGPAAKEGYILDFDTIYDKIRETVELGGTGVLMQGGLHPDLKIDWHEKMLRGIKERFPQVHPVIIEKDIDELLKGGFFFLCWRVEPLSLGHICHHLVINFFCHFLVCCFGGPAYPLTFKGKAHPPRRASSV